MDDLLLRDLLELYWPLKAANEKVKAAELVAAEADKARDEAYVVQKEAYAKFAAAWKNITERQILF